MSFYHHHHHGLGGKELWLFLRVFWSCPVGGLAGCAFLLARLFLAVAALLIGWVVALVALVALGWAGLNLAFELLHPLLSLYEVQGYA